MESWNQPWRTNPPQADSIPRLLPPSAPQGRPVEPTCTARCISGLATAEWPGAAAETSTSPPPEVPASWLPAAPPTSAPPISYFPVTCSTAIPVTCRWQSDEGYPILELRALVVAEVHNECQQTLQPPASSHPPSLCLSLALPCPDGTHENQASASLQRRISQGRMLLATCQRRSTPDHARHTLHRLGRDARRPK